MTAIALNKPRFWLPTFEPWRILRPLKMFDGQFHPGQRLQFQDGDIGPVVVDAGIELAYVGKTAAYTGGLTNPATFTDVDIGPAFSDRLVIVGINGDTNAGAAAAFNSVSIGGSAATIHSAPGGGRAPTVIASRLITSGTTATISVGTASTTFNNVMAFVWTLTGYQSATPVDTGGSNLSASGTSVSATLDIPANGVAVFVGVHRANSNHTWSSATGTDPDVAISTILRVGSVSKTTVSAIPGHTETLSFSSAIGRGIAAASWS